MFPVSWALGGVLWALWDPVALVLWPPDEDHPGCLAMQRTEKVTLGSPHYERDLL